jgi:hypothetical protein
MYSKQSLQPYNSQEFLCSTFNYKRDLIDAFLTLTHEEKLKMYLSVEERKLMGKMADEEGYKRILQEIARRVSIINPQPQS